MNTENFLKKLYPIAGGMLKELHSYDEMAEEVLQALVSKLLDKTTVKVSIDTQSKTIPDGGAIVSVYTDEKISYEPFCYELEKYPVALQVYTEEVDAANLVLDKFQYAIQTTV